MSPPLGPLFVKAGIRGNEQGTGHRCLVAGAAAFGVVGERKDCGFPLKTAGMTGGGAGMMGLPPIGAVGGRPAAL